MFNSPTLINDWDGQYEEVIAPGSFKRTISQGRPVLQFDHGQHPVLGSLPIGSIESLAEDARGLFVRARLFDSWMTEPLRQAIQAGAVDGMSFRFQVVKDVWDDRPTPRLRTIKEVRLHELGPVVFPAYESTSVGVRSILTHIDADERRALIQELAAELRLATDLSDAASRTSDPTPTPPPKGTSVNPHREALLSALAERRVAQSVDGRRARRWLVYRVIRAPFTSV